MKWESILDITRCDIPTSQSGGKSFNVYPFSWVITTLDRTLATNRPCPPFNQQWEKTSQPVSPQTLPFPMWYTQPIASPCPQTLLRVALHEYHCPAAGCSRNP